MTEVGVDILTNWIRRFRDAVVEHEADLTSLDRAIGDADHGSNLVRGMRAAVEKLESAPPATVADLGKAVGMTLVSTVGGASGPLYGTFFLRFGTGSGTASALEGDTLVAAFRAGVDGVVARGKAERGEKTMLDALGPALDALAAAVQDGQDPADALRAAADAAEQGRDATEPLVAHKGRASYLGERSAGHVDPGSASSALLVRALADAAGA